MTIIVLLICGPIIGVMSSFFGVGGGALMVPVLYSIFPEFSNTMVIATSLATIFILTTVNSFAYWREKYFPENKIVALIVIATFIGGYAGGLLSYKVDTQLSKKILSIVLILAIFKSYLFKPKLNSNTEVIVWKVFVTGLLGALLSSLTGLGGGIIFVPMLMSFVLLESNKISPYSNLMMMSATFMGTLPHLFKPVSETTSLINNFEKYFFGQVNFAIVFIFLLTGIIGAKIGRKFHHAVSEKTKKLSFAILLFILSIKLIVS